MESLRRLFWLHYQPAGPLITLWDEWMPMSTLWPAMGSERQLQTMRKRWAAALASRGMNTEGYVHTHQHDGLAHAEGWPFPLWTQAGGIGWHFRGTGVPATTRRRPHRKAGRWRRRSGTTVGPKGWEIELTEPQAAIQTPAVCGRCAHRALAAPELVGRRTWRAPTAMWNGPPRSNRSSVSERRAYFSPATQRRARRTSTCPWAAGAENSIPTWSRHAP